MPRVFGCVFFLFRFNSENLPMMTPTTNGPLSYFSFQPVLHDWFNKGCVIYV